MKNVRHVCWSLCVWEVYISRIIVRPHATVGNVYLTETNLVFFVQIGKVLAKFVRPDGTEEKEFVMDSQDGIVNVPPNVAFAMKNMDATDSVVVAFSDRPLNDHGDDKQYQVFS